MSDQAPAQSELPLPFPVLSGDPPLLPARMVNSTNIARSHTWNGFRASGRNRLTRLKVVTPIEKLIVQADPSGAGRG
jgi:hypothetical protein